MIWIVAIIGQLFLGFELSFFCFSSKFDVPTLFSLGIPVGFCVSSLLYYICSFFLRFNSLHLMIHIGIILFCGYALEMFRWRKKAKIFEKINREVIFFIISSAVLSVLIVPNMYEPEPGYVHSAFRGDIPEEISMINSFYQGCNNGFMHLFKIRHPVCYKCHARSKWLSALHSAMLLVGYSSLRHALVVPSLLIFFSICFLLQTLAFYFLKNMYLSFLSLILFLFAGGFGFTYWLERASRHNMSLDFVFNFGPKQTEWSHPLFHYIFALRPSQFSLSIVISIFLILTISPLGRYEMIYLGVLVGFLPAIQHQVFICTILYLAIFWGLTFPYHERKSTNEKLKFHIIFLISFGATSFFPLLHYFPKSNRVQMITKETFWNNYSNRGAFFAPIQVWYDALGFFPLITLVISWFFLNKRFLRFYIPSVIVFLFCNYYKFEGYPRHSIIVFYPFWITLASIVFMHTLRKLSNFPSSEEAQGVIIGLCGFLFLCNIWSSVLGYYRMRTSSSQAWTREMVSMAKWISENTPKNAVFISSDDEYDTVAVLAGKVSFLQSPRYAWMFGFDPEQSENDINYVLENPNTGVNPKIKYILNFRNVGVYRHFIHPDNPNWKEIYGKGNYTLYQRTELT